MNLWRSKVLVWLTLCCFLPGCAVKSHQFAYAVKQGNVNAAQSFHEPGYAAMKFSVTAAPGEYSLPIQYAILQKNKTMAKYLLENGSPKILQGRNLAYYCSYNGKDEMARYFAEIGEGSGEDITRAKRDLAENQRRQRQVNRTTALVGLLFLGALMSGMGGSPGGNSEPSNQEIGAMLKYDASIPASVRAGL